MNSDEYSERPTIQDASAKPPCFSFSRQFGEYELLEEIARGGAGIVYKARHKTLNRTVALKVLLAGRHASEDELTRFQTEAEAAARLAHPSIIPVFDVGDVEGHRYLSMAYVPGESLAQKITMNPLDPREAAQLVFDIAQAIEYAHQNDVIHRDLKPGNILLATDGKPIITDFGIAKQIHADQSLTGSGEVLGTPNFMPPEQAAGNLQEVGVQSDVYSMGAILYAAITGRPPFQAATTLETLLQVLEQTPVAPRQLNNGIARDLETIAMKCLEKEPSHRYQRAQEVADELERFLNGQPIIARPHGTLKLALAWCRMHLLVASVSGAGALVLVVLAISTTIMYTRESSLRQALEEEISRLEVSLKNTENALKNKRNAEQKADTATSEENRLKTR